jgi:heme/copper-type cytochrome/quinol oxidase subunit 4
MDIFKNVVNAQKNSQNSHMKKYFLFFIMIKLLTIINYMILF